MKTITPPIKCQGIKTKLVNWIKEMLPEYNGIWYEPFMGSGVIGFNVLPKEAVFSDTNPHIIQFYNDIKNDVVTCNKLRIFLTNEAEKLSIGADKYYKEVRHRFNEKPNSFDFIFLNRACFNGMMRFNSNGGFNVPFCKKPDRFAQAYITKIINQVKAIKEILEIRDYQFVKASYKDIIVKARKEDFIYCDPPYIDRYSDYFNSWESSDEELLYNLLSNTEAKFLLSTWYGNKFRKNQYIDKFWKNFDIATKKHFYYLGASETNRNEMLEALVNNYGARSKVIESNVIKIGENFEQLSFPAIN